MGPSLNLRSKPGLGKRVIKLQYRAKVSGQSRLETLSMILNVFKNRGSSFEIRESRIENFFSRISIRDFEVKHNFSKARQ